MNDNRHNILSTSLNKAIGGGLSGASAMGIQVVSLMWLRTTMNYQYRYGTTTQTAITTLYKQGGIKRFYKGIFPALFQGPLSRFGDTAANTGILHLLNSDMRTKELSTPTKTLAASSIASIWRIFIMPIDSLKTVMQVEGSNGIRLLRNKINNYGIRVLYHGSLASSGATFIGHYPWFVTYNTLNVNLPISNTMWGELRRNAIIGFSASFISDCSSNSIRVIKTTRQSFKYPISYVDSIKHIIKEDNIYGLFSRGLQTRILSNGLQSIMFTILFKGFQTKINV